MIIDLTEEESDFLRRACHVSVMKEFGQRFGKENLSLLLNKLKHAEILNVKLTRREIFILIQAIQCSHMTKDKESILIKLNDLYNSETIP